MTTDEKPEPRNVTEALARIMEEIGGIGKTHSAAAQQGGYKYRGVEDITERLQGLLAKYQVVAYPRGRITEIREIVVNGKPWTDTVVSYRFKIVHGPSGTHELAELPGIGRDNADKGANKGATQAFKYLWLETLCIADPKDDNDGTHDEAQARRSGGNGRAAPQQSQQAHEPAPDPATGEIPNSDVESMTLRELTEALQAAGLPLSGNTEAKRARLAEYRAAQPSAVVREAETIVHGPKAGDPDDERPF